MNPRTTSIDHHPRVKDELCAPQMFTHGHTLQLASVLRAHLVGLVDSTGLLPGLAEEVFVDVDSLLRPVTGTNKAPATGTPRSPASRSSAKACHRWPRSPAGPARQ